MEAVLDRFESFLRFDTMAFADEDGPCNDRSHPCLSLNIYKVDEIHHAVFFDSTGQVDSVTNFSLDEGADSAGDSNFRDMVGCSLQARDIVVKAWQGGCDILAFKTWGNQVYKFTLHEAEQTAAEPPLRSA